MLGGLSGRPGIFLVVTLLLFLSARSDLEQPDRQVLRQGAAGGAHAGVAAGESKAGGVVKEQVRVVICLWHRPGPGGET
jgi:hypothetical protein